MATGAEALVRGLERAGMPIVFGVPGIHNLPLVIQLKAQGLRFVALHSPSAAVLAASGYTRRSGKPAVALGGPGPGPLATLEAVAEARAGEVPLLLLRTLPEPPDLPGPPRPASPPPEPVVGHARARVLWSVSDDLITAVRGARDEAVAARSGPVAVDLAPGLLTGTARPEPEEDVHAEVAPRAAAAGVEHVQLRRAGNLVDDSQNVLIWAGGGALRAGAGGVVAELAEKVGAPVMTTVQAAGLLPARHPCLVGMPPHLPQVGRLWDDADLVIAIGTDFDEQATQGLRMPSPDSLIAINIDAGEAGRHYRPDVLLRGDARTLTKALADTVGYRGGTAVVRSRLEDIRGSVRRDLADSDPTAVVFLEAIAAALPDRTTVVADPSAAGGWLAAFHEWTLPRTLLFPSDIDAVGTALPIAIGAAATPSPEPVVAVIGDEGFLSHLGELAVLTREKLPLTVLVVDDGGPGRLRPTLAGMDSDPGLLDHASVDLAGTARTFGLRADVVTEAGEELTTALRAHIAAPDPTVLVLQSRLGVPPTDQSRWYRRNDGVA
ncbi:MAG TPA: thiamine pyrophosphate-binding protein [Euzebya sp.]|nr:thiamine pyrophosphate-binding protein [Euzebya sp.]